MTGERITEIYAWVVLDPTDNTEGIPATLQAADGTMMPLIGADRDRIESLRTWAAIAARKTGQPCELRRWRGPYETIDTIRP